MVDYSITSIYKEKTLPAKKKKVNNPMGGGKPSTHMQNNLEKTLIKRKYPLK